MRRVSIRAGSREVDVNLPAHIPVGEFLPATVDLVTSSDDQLRASLVGRSVGICRVGVPPLEPSRSLAQDGVADGELLILTTEHIAPPIYRFDPCSVIREAAESASSSPNPPSPHLPSPPAWPMALLCWGGGVELFFLARALTHPQQSHALVAGLSSSFIAALAAATFRRRDSTRSLSAMSAVWAAVFAAASGALAVPGHLTASHLLLAMSACSTVALGLAQLPGCGTTVLVPISGASGLATFVALGPALNWWPSAAIGPSLVLASLTTLALGPRLATLVARLAVEDSVDEDLYRRTISARGYLSKFVSTSACGAALGSVLTAAGGRGGVATGSLILAGAAVLLSHTRRHRDPYCVAALSLSGAAAITVFLFSANIHEFIWTPWLFSGIVPLTLTCAWLTSGACKPAIPFGEQIFSGIEFAMGAAVPALACWSMGLFSAARGLSLS